jgi:phage terminase large subunit-like protein
VLHDGTLQRPTPKAWGQRAVDLYEAHKADRVIGEVNHGGDLIEANVHAIDPNVPFKAVRASRGKAVRAEPIAALYEQSRVKHVGSFPQLEDQMTTWEPGVSTFSPNRVDALVWALTELMLGGAPARYSSTWDSYLPKLRI